MTDEPGPTLYELLPALHRRRDAERGLPLQALLGVAEEQRALVRASIEQSYADWFVETCRPWLLPYLGALVGYETPPGREDAPARCPADVTAPRRDVARTLADRRRKGTLAVLEDLARDVADWPARAVEFRRLLAFDQPVRLLSGHPAGPAARPGPGRLADLRRGGELDLADGPFDRLAHTADVRRVDSAHPPGGRAGVASVGLFVWRLGAYSVTRAPAYCRDRDRGHYTFSVLGNDTPLVNRPVREPSPAHIADETNLPAFIRRRAFEEDTAHYYGPGKSLCVWTDDGREPVPLSAVVCADLSGWSGTPRPGQVAVDPVLGRIAFPPRSAPDGGVRVSYHHAFPAPMGGGEYPRPGQDPAGGPPPERYRVGPGERFGRLMDAVAAWRGTARPGRPRPEGIVELVGPVVLQERIEIPLDLGDRLTVRAAPGGRPVLRLLNRYAHRPDSLRITGTGEGGGPLPSLRLSGLLVTGRGVHVEGPVGRVALSHCTLVPGWSLDEECPRDHPGRPSLELTRTPACLDVEHSITGAVTVTADEPRTTPNRIFLSDSVLDATARCLPALSGPDGGCAYARLSARRTTVIGAVRVHETGLVEDSILDGPVHAEIRDRGLIRFSYLPPGSRTPPPFHCEPAHSGDPERVTPRFTSTAYGSPGYVQLAADCAEELRRGAADGSEPGAFHDLFQPQREDALRARLAEYTPAGTSSGLLFAT
ncbi:hypothetical protein GCM10010302_64880 [Streptomyces polychromogenes]|uniref:Uncharacterized protein n=1 Tax=Streptomyces polychromogenes TaxID=67342 RepID=A0ABN0VTB5_9ACTN